MNRARWRELRARVRQKAAHLTPAPLALFPFEVFIAALGLLTGLPIVFGLREIPALLAVIGSLTFKLWALASVLGGGTVLVGLLLRRAMPLVVASGLQLSSMVHGVYGLAAVLVIGWTLAWPVFGVYMTISALALIRAMHFRRLDDIQRGAARIGRPR